MREFRQQHGRTDERYWQVWFQDAEETAPVAETVAYAWGAITKGKHKEHGRSSDRPGPKGKEDTKAWISAADNAVFHHDRMIRKKLEEGYNEVGLDGHPLLGGSADEIDHSLPLPKNLCFSKPKNGVSAGFIAKLEKAADIIWTRKVNGMMVIAHIDAAGTAHAYSRRMDSLSTHFPHLVRALGPNGMCFPPCSVLLFEAFWGDGNTQPEFQQVQSVMRSKVDRALDIQSEEGFLKFYLLRVPVWKGDFLEQTRTCEEMVYTIENFFADRFIEYREDNDPEQFLYTLEVFEGPESEARALAEENGYEGWVGYQRSGVMGHYSFSFHGKPDRPSCAFKMKVEEEDDFICRWDPDNSVGAWGTGKNKTRVGTLALYQHGPNGVGEVYVCEVGSGLTDSMRDQLTDKEQYPLVAEIRFQARSYKQDGAKSNALTHPRVIRFRTDKDPEECVNEQLTSPA